jgi:branched-chain amino acid transport system permease protein
MAALGLNILVGYCGQISLGTGGFMAVGAYASYKLTTVFFPDLGMIFIFLLSGLVAAVVGVFFGLPSLRIKGFYLAVATLAAQFFLTWLFNKVGWFFNYNSNGTIESPPRTLFGSIMEPGGVLEALSFLNPLVTSPRASPATKYLFALTLVVVFALIAKNLVRGRIGRSWMAIRDMDIAAELIGIRPMQTKLLAFAVSSFYCGVAGAMLLNLYLNSVETQAFAINVSFDVLFMVIIGGLGSIMGSFLGAGFIILMPILLTNLLPAIGLPVDTATQRHIELMLFGGLMIFFLIVEPHGFARLWQVGKEKLRLWPYPH